MPISLTYLSCYAAKPCADRGPDAVISTGKQIIKGPPASREGRWIDAPLDFHGASRALADSPCEMCRYSGIRTGTHGFVRGTSPCWTSRGKLNSVVRVVRQDGCVRDSRGARAHARPRGMPHPAKPSITVYKMPLKRTENSSRRTRRWLSRIG